MKPGATTALDEEGSTVQQAFAMATVAGILACGGGGRRLRRLWRFLATGEFRVSVCP